VFRVDVNLNTPGHCVYRLRKKLVIAFFSIIDFLNEFFASKIA